MGATQWQSPPNMLRRMITEEMQFIAKRKNVEAEFVRLEVTRGRAANGEFLDCHLNLLLFSFSPSCLSLDSLTLLSQSDLPHQNHFITSLVLIKDTPLTNMKLSTTITSSAIGMIGASAYSARFLPTEHSLENKDNNQ